MASPTDGAAIVLTHEGEIDPTLIRDVLVQVQGLNRIDAMQAARRATDEGVLTRGVPLGAAKATAAALAKHKIEAIAMPADKVPERPAPERVRNVDCRSKGLAIFDLRAQEVECVPWDRFLLLSVGVIRQPKETKRVHTSGDMGQYGAGLYARPSTASQRPRSRTVEPPPRCELWLATRPPYRWLRFIEEQLNYDYLGKRKQLSATVNFQLLLTDVLRLTPESIVTPATESFIRKDKPGSHDFKSEEDFSRYNTRQLVLALSGTGVFG